MRRAGPGDIGPDHLKTGTRPTDPPPFGPITVWAYDECDLTADSQDEVRTRVQQTLRLQEQIAVERAFAAGLLADAPPAPAPGDIVAAISRTSRQSSPNGSPGKTSRTPGTS